MLRYSIELSYSIYAKGCAILSFPKLFGKNWSTKCRQKIIDSRKNSARSALRTALKKAIQKKAEATNDLIGNKIWFAYEW